MSMKILMSLNALNVFDSSVFNKGHVVFHSLLEKYLNEDAKKLLSYPYPQTKNPLSAFSSWVFKGLNSKEVFFFGHLIKYLKVLHYLHFFS